MRRIRLTGKQFGAWTVGQYAGLRDGRKPMWACVCVCGTEREVDGQALRTRRTNSCGCLKPGAIAKSRTIHGRSVRSITAEFRAWQSMRIRCSANNKQMRHLYYDRGITICARWSKFGNFLADMGPIPRAGLTLDRIENDGIYEPSNCRWADCQMQAQNRRPFSEWATA